jgi:hypothetical protein
VSGDSTGSFFYKIASGLDTMNIWNTDVEPIEEVVCEKRL